MASRPLGALVLINKQFIRRILLALVLFVCPIATVKGARTSFFSPELDRLFLAVRRQGSQSAAIQVFVPAP